MPTTNPSRSTRHNGKQRNASNTMPTIASSQSKYETTPSSVGYVDKAPGQTTPGKLTTWNLEG